MVDRCIFFDELLELGGGSDRSYVVFAPTPDLAGLDARLRLGHDWIFARRWVRTHAAPTELYRAMDRLAARGFAFRLEARSRRLGGAAWADEWAHAEWTSASDLLKDLTADERRVHAELFPDDALALARGYDWDRNHVYREGKPLAADAFGRVLEAVDDVLYEWVRVEEAFTWRRYPLQRIRVAVTPRGT